MFKKSLTTFFILFSLTGCDTPISDPVVSSFNGDSVALQVHGINVYTSENQLEENRAKLQQQADEICRRGQRKKAEYVSVRTVQTGRYSRL